MYANVRIGVTPPPLPPICMRSNFDGHSHLPGETVPFHKIFTPGNWVKLRCFSQGVVLQDFENLVGREPDAHFLF